jgi:hypothetical protein
MRRVAQVGLHVFYRFNPRGYTPAPARTGDIVLASLQTGSTSPVPTEFRLAAALVGKAADAVDPTVPAPAATPPAEAAAEAKPVVTAPELPSASKPAPKVVDLPQPGLSKAADAGSISHKPADSAVS